MSFDSSSGFCQPRYFSDESYIPAQNPNTYPYNLINFIAVAQKLKLAFLQVSWQPGKRQIGAGASGRLHQAFINLHASFAFKRVSNSLQESVTEDAIFRFLISEIIILTHPRIRRHPHIIRLEGVCWDTSTDEQGKDTIWPVLVFEKSQHGDLENFIQSPAGRKLGIVERIKICWGVGWAISDMHTYKIVHGDVKPANVLVFEDDKEYKVRVIDFGFSTRFASENDQIFVASSRPWSAPERNRDHFPAVQVQQMDLFSFGMLFIWVLFEKYLSGIVPLPEDARCWAEPYFEGKGQQSLSMEVLEELKRDNQLTRLAKQLATDEEDLDAEDRELLQRFFNEALSLNPQDRVHALEAFGYTKIRDAQSFEQAVLDEYNFEDSQCRFELTLSVTSFYKSDYRVRRYIRRLLEQQFLAVSDTYTAFQCALCNYIGFGGPREEDSLANALQHSGKSQKDLEDAVARMISLKVDMEQRVSKRYLKLEKSGHVPNDSPADQYSVDGILQEAQSAIEKEIFDLKDSLGESSGLWMINATELFTIYQALGQWKKAKDLRVQLIGIGKTKLDEGDPTMLTREQDLAATYNKAGRWKEAQELQLQVVEVRKNLLGKDHPDTLKCIETLARMYNDEGQWKKAEELQVHILEIRKEADGEEHQDTLRSMDELASTYQKQGQWEISRKLRTQAVNISKKSLGVKHRSTLILTDNLARAHSLRGNWKDAQELQEQVVEARKTVLGQRHPDTLASMTDLAATLSRQGKHVEAEHLNREILALAEDSLKENPSTWTTLNNLAESLKGQGKYADAEQIQREVLRLQEKVRGRKHTSTLVSINNLAGTLGLRGNYTEAASMLQEGLVLSIDIRGKEHAQTLTLMNNLALQLSRIGKFAEAEKMHSETLAARKKILGTEHMDTLISMMNLSLAFRDQGRYAEAEQIAKEELVLREKEFGKNHGFVLVSMNNLAKIHISQERYAEAETILQEAVKRKIEVSGEKHPDTLMVKNNLAEALSGQEKWTEAQQMHQEILFSRLALLGGKHPETVRSTVNLANTLSGQGKHKEALLLYEQACTTYRDTLGPDHPDAQACLKHCVDSRQLVDEEFSKDIARKNAEAGAGSDVVPSSNPALDLTELIHGIHL